MSHFYGVLSGSRGDATRCGTKNSGIIACVMSWSGGVKVSVHHSETDEKDHFYVEQIQHPQSCAGIRESIASGIIGEPTARKDEDRDYIIHALKSALDHIAATDEDSSGRMVRIALEIAIQKAEG